jgi:hypothetical protein
LRWSNAVLGGKALGGMKIGCECGAVIVDQTDYLPHKGHLIPDQDWFDTLDAVDDEVVNRLVAGEITKDDAYWQVRVIIIRSVRMVYECRECGRLYIDDHEGNLQSYVPENRDASKEILRSKGRKLEQGDA